MGAVICVASESGVACGPACKFGVDAGKLVTGNVGAAICVASGSDVACGPAWFEVDDV